MASASLSMLFGAAVLVGPATTTAAAPVPASPPTWSTAIVNRGDQAAVDECLGGLTRWFEDVDGKPYYPIHRRCGGTPVLRLRLGDRVDIGGASWLVTDARDVRKGDSYAAATGMDGQILVQTCYHSPTLMRIVALTTG